MSIRIGILGYGNLGRGVECALKQNPDMELKAVFTRRAPETVEILTKGVPVLLADEAEKMKDEIDVLILCGGSATDLPAQTPKYSQWFNVVDSFDTHAKIPEHFEAVDETAKKGGKVAVISAGWDPGMFSIARVYAMAALPEGENYTFWGKGVSQGHSDAIRRLEGVKDARQYTIPVESALEEVRSGKNPELTTRQKHTRECFVVAEEGAKSRRLDVRDVHLGADGGRAFGKFAGNGRHGGVLHQRHHRGGGENRKVARTHRGGRVAGGDGCGAAGGKSFFKHNIRCS